MMYSHNAQHHLSEPTHGLAPVLWSLAAVISILLMAIVIYIRVNSF